MNNEIYLYAGGMIPQIKKTWKQQSAKELSYTFMGMIDIDECILQDDK